MMDFLYLLVIKINTHHRVDSQTLYVFVFAQVQVLINLVLIVLIPSALLAVKPVMLLPKNVMHFIFTLVISKP